MRPFLLVPLLLAIASAGCEKPAATPAVRQPLKIVVSGDTAGWITPCGCTSNQSGGLLRRGSYIADLKTHGPVLYLDAGGAIHGNSDYDRLKFEAILAGEKSMGIAAHNIGRAEAALGAPALRQLCQQGYPLISANARDAAGQLIAEPFLIVSMAGRRIAIVGVLSPRFAAEGLHVDEPRPAILDAAAGAKGKFNTLIVLAYLPQAELEALAGSIPEADAVIGGPTGQPVPPRQLGPTLLTSATNKGKFLATIDLPATGAMTAAIVEMNASFPDDAAQKANLQSYLSQLGHRDLTPSQTGLTQPLPPGTPADYRIAGSEACATCHAGDYATWQHTGHARAWQTLIDRHFEVDPDCMQCHTTGYGLPGGFATRAATPLRVSVSCESCHGPSAAHVADAHHRTPFKAADQCTQCHDPENSPKFDFTSYWAKIQHGPATRPSGVN